MPDSNRSISFLRNEVIFNNKKSIVINVRDLTDQDGLFDLKAKIKQLNKAVERLSHELDQPLSAVTKSANLFVTNFERKASLPPIIKKLFDEIQS